MCTSGVEASSLYASKRFTTIAWAWILLVITGGGVVAAAAVAAAAVVVVAAAAVDLFV